MSQANRVRSQYERWPYPSYPLVASVPRRPLWQVHHAYLADRCGLRGAARPRLWIAGCGTFQPHVVARAHPEAEVLATDWSRHSLAIARRRCIWHGHGNVRLGHCNLDDLEALPEGPFDGIECYGVLMCLADPAATLRALADRLAPHGVLRLMVYPTYGRHRVFQIQQLARDFGITIREHDAPRRLRELIGRLPTRHPLRYAFDSYTDARSDAGLVDGFLHASDRGFTGRQLGALAARAGLEAGAWHHRDFADPRRVDESFASSNEFEIAHQLDLWQELRGNFVVCLRKARGNGPGSVPGRLHPHLDPWHAGLPWFERLGLLAARITGRTLPDTLASDPDDAPLHISGGELRALAAGATERIAPYRLDQLRQHGIWLDRASANPDPTTDANRRGDPEVALDRVVPETPPGTNPLYAALFAAWLDGSGTGSDRVATLRERVRAWDGLADPLESPRVPFGLTPIGTYRAHRAAIEAYIDRPPTAGPGNSSDPEPAKRRNAVHRWCRHAGVRTPELDEPARRQRLWHTLCNAHDLFDPATAAPKRTVLIPARAISRSGRESATPDGASRPA